MVGGGRRRCPHVGGIMGCVVTIADLSNVSYLANSHPCECQIIGGCPDCVQIRRLVRPGTGRTNAFWSTPADAVTWYSCRTSPLGIGAFLWLMALGRVELSQAYPFVGIGFALTTRAGWYLLMTRFPRSAFGIALVIGGIVLVGKS